MQTGKRSGRRTTARLLAFVLSLTAFAAPGHAQLRLDITEGVNDAVPVAVVPFGGQTEGAATDVAAVVAGDLRLSGRFAPLAREDLVTRPTSAAEIHFEDWRLLKADYIVIGRVEAGGAAVSFELYNVQTGQQLLTGQVASSGQNLRPAAHRISDLVFERLTGIPGAFSTRVAYVAVDGRPPSRHYRLVVADADGFNPRTVAESGDPIMSPAWSPDGQSLAYVSFETKASAIYVQRLGTGERRRVSARSGINGAPVFSPDGTRLAITLSRDGNLDIYVLDLATQGLTRLTSDDAIDTEAAWTPDGKGLYFTSDRAGNAQIYRLSLASPSDVQRITYTNGYNARARVSPDGSTLAMVTLDRGYRIGLMDLKNHALRVLTNGPQDESPSFAPNSAVLIYATEDRGRGSLAMVSGDGRYQERLSSDRGDVREPVWSPYPPH